MTTLSPQRHRRGRGLRSLPGRLANGLATAFLVVLLVGLGTAILPRAVGYRTLLIRSGSMGATAPTGSLVVARSVPATDVRVGSVILMHPGGDANGLPTLHRVVELSDEGGRTVVRTKGDANDTIDPNPYVLDDSMLVPVYVVPGVGYVVAAVSTPVGWGLLVLLPAALFTALFLMRVWSPTTAADVGRSVPAVRAR